MIRESEILRCLSTEDWTTVLKIFLAVGTSRDRQSYTPRAAKTKALGPIGDETSECILTMIGSVLNAKDE